MELLDAVKKRYSCRAYQDRPVDEATLNKILDAARMALEPAGLFNGNVFFDILLDWYDSIFETP